MKHSAWLYVIGPILIALGLTLVWLGTLGRTWNNTHDRRLKKTPHVSPRQAAYNNIAGVVGGLISVAGGIAIIVYQAS